MIFKIIRNIIRATWKRSNLGLIKQDIKGFIYTLHNHFILCISSI